MKGIVGGMLRTLEDLWQILFMLTARGEELHQELGREWYLVGAGLKSNPEFQQIYQRYADLTAPDVVDEARSSGVLELFEWAADLAIGRRTAALEEAQIIWETGAVLRVDGGFVFRDIR